MGYCEKLPLTGFGADIKLDVKKKKLSRGRRYESELPNSRRRFLSPRVTGDLDKERPKREIPVPSVLGAPWTCISTFF